MKIAETISIIGRALESIEQGAFLTVQVNGQMNTMTIGWATMGVCWRKPVMMVAVRDSRHTYSIIDAASDFSISMPDGDMRDEIFYCGTKSGREVDKLQECGLTTRPAQKVSTPIIDIAGLHVECNIVYKSAMEPAFLAEELQSLYPEKDYHTLYFGEVVACYRLNGPSQTTG